VCSSDLFRKFLFYVWAFLNLPKPTPVQYDIAYYLQHGPRRAIIQAFRGVGKSWITSAFVCWCLLNDPDTKILVVSASKERADSFSTFTKRLIREMPMLTHLKPRPDKGHRDSNVAFDVGPARADHAPSVKSVGITGQMTGSRANRIIADDIEVPSNSMTQLNRDRLSESVKEFDAVLKPGGSVTYLGTPQSEMSVYSVLEERGYELRIWPGRYPKEKLRAAYGARLAPYIANKLAEKPELAESKHSADYGQPTDSARFDELDLEERHLSYGRSGFALQFMLDTSIADGDRYPLKLRDLIVMGVAKSAAPLKVEWGSGPHQQREDIPVIGLAGERLHRPAFVHADYEDFTGAVLFIDPAGRGADETGFAVVKMLNGILYVRRCGGFKGGYDEATLKALAKIAKDEEVNFLRIESNFGDGMFTALFRPVLRKEYLDLFQEDETDVRHGQQKEARIIDTLEPVISAHRLVVDEEVLRKDSQTEDPTYSLMYQMTRLTRERGALAHDDRVDALAGAVGFWTERMSRDADETLEARKKALAQEELDQFMARARGRRVEKPNWTGQASRHS